MKHNLFLLAFCMCLAFSANANATDVQALSYLPEDRSGELSITNIPNKSEKESYAIYQQQKETVSGRIIDLKGDPIIGAYVIEVDEPGNGTVTNIDGEFSLLVKKNATLEISYIGYETQRVNYTSGQKISVTLTESLETLDEVVVVGYGQQRVATVTGAVSQIKTDKITVAPQANVTNMLAGQLPGLITKQTSGIPGADNSSLNIRGFGSPLME